MVQVSRGARARRWRWCLGQEGARARRSVGEDTARPRGLWRHLPEGVLVHASSVASYLSSFLSRPQLPSPLAWSPMRPPSRLALAVQDASVSALASRCGTSPGRPAVSGGVWATDQGMGSDCADLPSDAIGRLVRRRQDLDKKTRVAILTLAENTAAAVQAEKGVGVFAGCVCLRARGGGWAVGGRE